MASSSSTPASATTGPGLHSSRFLHLLNALVALEGGLAAGDFARRLSEWVDYTEAIALHALQGAAPGTAEPAATIRHDSAAQALHDAHARLRHAIEAAPLPPPDEGKAATAGTVDGFEPYRRYYVEQQRALEAAVAPLRAELRVRLSQGSGAQAQLAALDARLEGIVGLHEGRLLATVPRLMLRRFAQLQAEATAPGPSWQKRFGRELQALLLAELELRLQPAMGLLDALAQQQPTLANA